MIYMLCFQHGYQCCFIVFLCRRECQDQGPQRGFLHLSITYFCFLCKLIKSKIALSPLQVIQQEQECDQVGLREGQQKVQHATLFGYAVRQSCTNTGNQLLHFLLAAALTVSSTEDDAKTHWCRLQSWSRARQWRAALAALWSTALTSQRWHWRPSRSSSQTRLYDLKETTDRHVSSILPPWHRIISSKAWMNCWWRQHSLVSKAVFRDWMSVATPDTR